VGSDLPASAQAMLAWMESATLPAARRTAAAIDGVRISAKTGTRRVADPRTGSYSRSDFIASMIGIFPTDDPRLIVYVVEAESRGQSYYGSQIAAPIFREVAVSLMDKLGNPAGRDDDGSDGCRLDESAGRSVRGGGNRPGNRAVMPDLRGTPKKLLLPLLLAEGPRVTINGSGFVVTQDLRPVRASRTA